MSMEVKLSPPTLPTEVGLKKVGQRSTEVTRARARRHHRRRRRRRVSPRRSTARQSD